MTTQTTGTRAGTAKKTGTRAGESKGVSGESKGLTDTTTHARGAWVAPGLEGSANVPVPLCVGRGLGVRGELA